MNHAALNRVELEIKAWQERYFALVKEVANIEGIRRTSMMLADKEAYELGRLHGATEEREACAKVCEERSVMGWTGELKVDMATINKAKDCAAAIRERKS
jgi:hypothetical protein